VREYALVFAVAAAVTYLLTPLVRVLAVRGHAMAQPRDRDVHAIPTPRLGGVAMYGGVAAAFLTAHQLPALQETFRRSSETTAVLIAGGLICLLGVVDDRWGLDALTKLAGQVVAAGVMVLLGVQLLMFYVPGGTGTVLLSSDQAVPLTVLLCVLTVNAINFIDGLDGLAAGVAGIAALAFFAYSYHLSREENYAVASAPTLVSAVLGGACLGFLPHNFQPARIFMGDSGSMLIGLMLAAAATAATGRADPQTFGSSDVLPLVLPLLIPLAVLAVPFVDLVLAVLRRARAGRSPFSPDKMHLHHRLLEIGHSHRRAVLIMYFWSALLAFGGVSLTITDGPLLVLAVMATLGVVAVLASGIPRLRAARPR